MPATNTTVAATEVGSGKITAQANVVDSVTFERDCDYVRVINVDGAAEIWFTDDGTTPTVGGRESRWVPATTGAYRDVTVRTAGNTVIKLKSSGTPVYLVEGSL